jgi:hypothetical protein
MTSPIPTSALSDHFQEHMKGRRLRSAVFLTFQFDPGFFEQEVLPVFVDTALSHAKRVRLAQLDDALREVPGRIAVYYDQNGLVPGTGSARLDIDRIPVRHQPGIFHPKNIFAIVEELDADKDGVRAQTLLVAAMSANLTRSGWWENVEVCHVEELRRDEPCSYLENLLAFLVKLDETRIRSGTGSAALTQVLAFVRSVPPGPRRREQPVLEFYAGPWGADPGAKGKTRVAAFLAHRLLPRLRSSGNVVLEIISPYLDKGEHSKPLTDLIDAFAPREVRVLLPMDDGTCQCSPELHQHVKELPNVEWARLSAPELLKNGSGASARERRIHAKVIRIYQLRPTSEFLFIGSVNLTSPAHNGANVETAFLVEVREGRPQPWLENRSQRPKDFAVPTGDEDTATTGGTQLSIQFSWATHEGKTHWDDSKTSPPLVVSSSGIRLFALGGCPPREWIALTAEHSAAIERELQSTSLLTVSGDGASDGLLLIQEIDMEKRPSLIENLTAAEILQFWATKPPDERAAYLESLAPEALLAAEGADLVAKAQPLPTHETLFGRFAGIFHAFSCLDRTLREALESQGTDHEKAPANEKKAVYLLFGAKYDALRPLLDRIEQDSSDQPEELVNQYVITLCAKQLVAESTREFPNFWERYRGDGDELRGKIKALCAHLHSRLRARQPEQMAEFLPWFEGQFARRAKRAIEVAS